MGPRSLAGVAALALLAAACGGRPVASPPPSVAPRQSSRWVAPLPPWEQRGDAGTAAPPEQQRPVVIENAKIAVGDGRVIERGHLVFERGKLSAVGAGAPTRPAGAVVIDAGGRLVTPGLVDTHSHIGVYPMPHARAHDDGNEATAPVAAEVRAKDAFWAQDPAIERAVAGGVTTLQILPGSANLVGGRSVTVKLRRSATLDGMRMAGAPEGLKMACGENPKRVYGERKQAPSTRMGNLAGQRAAFLEARQLIEEWRTWRDAEQERVHQRDKARAKFAAKTKERELRRQWCEAARVREDRRRCDAWKREWAKEELEEPKPESESLPPARNLRAETLAGVLGGKILLQIHCYRADDMMRMLELADEMGVQIRSFHHALEAYKIRSELARRKVAVSTWADWWGFKLEAYDGIPENIALLELAGARPVVHSDSAEGVQRLNQEAAKALWAGRHAGLAVDASKALTWVTRNPAWVLGVEARIGTLEVGKDADVVLWSADPLSVYAKAELVFIDGVQRFDAKAPAERWSDFEVEP